MYFVNRSKKEIVVTGPNDFEKILPEDAIVVIKKPPNRDDWNESPKPTTVRVKDMTNAELVAFVLEL